MSWLKEASFMYIAGGNLEFSVIISRLTLRRMWCICVQNIPSKINRKFLPQRNQSWSFCVKHTPDPLAWPGSGACLFGQIQLDIYTYPVCSCREKVPSNSTHMQLCSPTTFMFQGWDVFFIVNLPCQKIFTFMWRYKENYLTSFEIFT